MTAQACIKVLLADDHKVFREGIGALLRNEPSIDIVAEAGNGKEVLEVLRNKDVDVVILDIRMPEMNGLEAAKAIREKYPGIRILVFTSYDEVRYVREMLQIEVTGYVLKTTGSEELIAAIQTVYRGDNYSSQAISDKIRQHFLSEQKRDEELTEREQEILKLVAQGYTNAQIGEQLFISPRTVDTHRRNLLQKLDLHNAVELSQYAYKHGIMD